MLNKNKSHKLVGFFSLNLSLERLIIKEYSRIKFVDHVICATCAKNIYLKYFIAATVMNFSMKISESRTAMWAARPMMEFAVLGRAWTTS